MTAEFHVETIAQPGPKITTNDKILDVETVSAFGRLGRPFVRRHLRLPFSLLSHKTLICPLSQEPFSPFFASLTEREAQWLLGHHRLKSG